MVVANLVDLRKQDSKLVVKKAKSIPIYTVESCKHSRIGTNSNSTSPVKGFKKKKKKERNQLAWLKVYLESAQVSRSPPQPQQRAGRMFLEERHKVCLSNGWLSVWRGRGGLTAEGSEHSCIEGASQNTGSHADIF